MNRIAIMAVASLVIMLGLVGYTVFQVTQPSPAPVRQSREFVGPSYDEQQRERQQQQREWYEDQEIERLQDRVRELEGGLFGRLTEGK